nr:MAG TPA: hypothetical protein [Caudoviricetes sp.]DAG57892.1 MAG TPA: hypothetical protein [Caudoviricetes sp.]
MNPSVSLRVPAQHKARTAGAFHGITPQSVLRTASSPFRGACNERIF